MQAQQINDMHKKPAPPERRRTDQRLPSKHSLMQIQCQVQRPHLQHFLAGLWHDPEVRHMLQVHVPGFNPGDQMLRAVRLARSSPLVKSDEVDVVIVMTVMTRLGSLVHRAAQRQTALRSANGVHLRQALVSSTKASLAVLAKNDPGGYRMISQAMAFHTGHASLQLLPAELEFHARVQTVVLGAWLRCSAAEAPGEVGA